MLILILFYVSLRSVTMKRFQNLWQTRKCSEIDGNRTENCAFAIYLFLVIIFVLSISGIFQFCQWFWNLRCFFWDIMSFRFVYFTSDISVLSCSLDILQCLVHKWEWHSTSSKIEHVHSCTFFWGKEAGIIWLIDDFIS